MELGLTGTIIRYAVQTGCVLLMASGLWCSLGNTVKSMFREEQQYRRLEKTVNAKKPEQKSFTAAHIGRLLTAVRKGETTESQVYLFIAVTILIFLFSIFTAIKIFSLIISIAIAATAAAFPYLLLRIRLRNKQIDSSYDADTLVTSLINEYKQHNLSMIKAVENSALAFDAGSSSGRILYRLALALKDYRDEEELDRALEQFVYSYSTEWAALLRANIKMAVLRGTDVSSGLEDILKKLKDIGEQLEAGKRYNNEAVAMIRFLLVPLYLGSIYMAVQTFGFTIKKFLEYQFVNTVGLRTGIITLLLIMTSFVSLKLICKPKYDI
ncbi:hypothetical protein LY28_03636 [Ruminiclostridium sufflavum DSM 19573]|uniref:Tight adherence protein B n=1 Tax=Ruminiclostridium sufflavum DSM 19573 TaxID=1121337 RepID=A0A318XJI9_9FIRM|nr:hypothetical protein [Ruminiclostridium sufflavum]PYG84322.1 hypothetical protein LY28_03636 [Ruminiclostridium sufflavum DSM 19573]